MTMTMTTRNIEILNRLLEIRRKPLHDFRAWDTHRRDLASVALDNFTPVIRTLLLDWISQGDMAPAFGHRLFDALYEIHIIDAKYTKGADFWYQTYDFDEERQVRTWRNCILTKPMGGLTVWSRVDKIEV